MFKKILLITNKSASEVGDTLRTVVDCLTAGGAELILDEHCAGLLPQAGMKVRTRTKEKPRRGLGGDGASQIGGYPVNAAA